MGFRRRHEVYLELSMKLVYFKLIEILNLLVLKHYTNDIIACLRIASESSKRFEGMAIFHKYCPV